MSDTYDSATASQPLPVGTPRSEPVAPAVLERVLDRLVGEAHNQEVAEALLVRLAQRDVLGRRKYGMSLVSLNGRDPDVDLLEELLDAAQYAQQRVLERDARVAVLQVIQRTLAAAYAEAAVTSSARVLLQRGQVDVLLDTIEQVLPGYGST